MKPLMSIMFVGLAVTSMAIYFILLGSFAFR